MDEVGRGTTVKDGLAIAFATVNHLYTVNKCRALFATHFQDLVDMLGYSEHNVEVDKTKPFRDIGFFCNDVDETEVFEFDKARTVRLPLIKYAFGIGWLFYLLTSPPPWGESK